MKKILGYLRVKSGEKKRRGVSGGSGGWMRFQIVRMSKMNQALISMTGSK